MKRALYIITLLAVGTTAYFVGATGTGNTVEAASRTESQIETISDRYIDMDSDEFIENYIDLRTVTGYSGTETGLMLYTDDGCGYYLEAEQVK
ncbi:hypothetical protein ACTNEW_03835 [Blautia sp. HCP3S3_G3]|uniref:hypothetical protein n=1 Tax=Blautia sp. HCP3S3_G3 TaxID=3438913 RepID=UPI003F8ACA01